MTTEKLESLTKQGEGYTLEFKENLGKKFAVEVVAFANSIGGTILIGLDDHGNIIGTDTSNNQRANIQKQKLRVQKIHHRIDNIRTNYMNKAIAEIVKTKPSYITIEDLNVKGMMKNRHLSKAVASQKFSGLRTKLKIKCDENGIELRIADRYYPSSKLCHCCGHIKKDLKLSDRIYKCECGYIEDRDFNASLNLRDAKIYEVA